MTSCLKQNFILSYLVSWSSWTWFWLSSSCSTLFPPSSANSGASVGTLRYLTRASESLYVSLDSYLDTITVTINLYHSCSDVILFFPSPAFLSFFAFLCQYHVLVNIILTVRSSREDYHFFRDCHCSSLLSKILSSTLRKIHLLSAFLLLLLLFVNIILGNTIFIVTMIIMIR